MKASAYLSHFGAYRNNREPDACMRNSPTEEALRKLAANKNRKKTKDSWTPWNVSGPSLWSNHRSQS